MSSDESMFRQFDNAKQYVRHPSEASSVSPKYTVATVNHPPQVVIWRWVFSEKRWTQFFAER